MAELAAPMSKYPQVLENVRTRQRVDLNASSVIRDAVSAAERKLGDGGRIVLRPSGTEPVIRVMVEGRDEKLVKELAKQLANSVASAAEAAG